MLLGFPTRYGTGLELYGDPFDFEDLSETIHYLAGEEGPLPYEVGNSALGLAYELRHANQGDRKSKIFYDKHDIKITYNGFEYFWIYILFDYKILRQAAAEIPTTPRHQANLYSLWACINDALRKGDSKVAENCFNIVNILPFFGETYEVTMVTEAASRLVAETPNGKQRLKNLPNYLAMLLPNSLEYKAYEKWISNERHVKGETLPMEVIHNFPSFKW